MLGFIRRIGHKVKSFFNNTTGSISKFYRKATASITPEAKNTPHLTGEALTMAKISQSVYNKKRPDIIDDYKLDDELSKYNVGVYQNPALQKVIIGFRGTASIEDLETDLDIVKGKTDERQYKDAVELYNKVKSKYPNYEILATGHSKGGSLALYLNTLYNIKIYGFNSGVGLGVIKTNPNRDNANLYIIKGDIISSFASLGKLGIIHVYNSIYPDPSPLQAHSMSNYLSTK